MKNGQRMCKKGTILFSTFFVLLIIGIIAVTSTHLGTKSLQFQKNNENIDISWIQAKSGIERGRYYLQSIGTSSMPLTYQKSISGKTLTLNVDYKNSFLLATATYGGATSFISASYTITFTSQVPSVEQISSTTYEVTTFVEIGSSSIDGTVGGTARVKHPHPIFVNSVGNMLFVDDHKILREIVGGQVITRVSDKNLIDETKAIASRDSEYPIAYLGQKIESAGNKNVVQKYLPPSTISSYAGSSNGNVDGLNSSAKFKKIKDAFMHTNGDIYVADKDNKSVRKVASTTTSTILSESDFKSLDSGDNGKVVSVTVSPITDTLHILTEKNYYTYTSAGVLSKVFSLDNGDARPKIIRADSTGEIFFVAKIYVGKIVDGIPYVIAGSKTEKNYVDGTAEEARFEDLSGLGVIRNGSDYIIYVTDKKNGIRKIVGH